MSDHEQIKTDTNKRQTNKKRYAGNSVRCLCITFQLIIAYTNR